VDLMLNSMLAVTVSLKTPTIANTFQHHLHVHAFVQGSLHEV
jgi:hypothetical protein